MLTRYRQIDLDFALRFSNLLFKRLGNIYLLKIQHFILLITEKTK